MTCDGDQTGGSSSATRAPDAKRPANQGDTDE